MPMRCCGKHAARARSCRAAVLGLVALLVGRAAGASEASEQFFVVPLAALEITQGELPGLATNPWTIRWPGRDARADLAFPYVLLDGPGEAFVLDLRAHGDWSIRLCARVPHKGDLSGRLVVPGASGEARIDCAFRVPAARAGADPAAYADAWERYNAQLAACAIPGAAWFRSRAGDHEGTAGVGVSDDAFALFSSARHVAEHVPLASLRRWRGDVVGMLPEPATPDVAHAAECAELAAGRRPEVDALARAIPADQHAVFFKDARALVRTIEEALRGGTPILRLAEETAVHTDVRGRYERQLGVPLDALAATGTALAGAVAITGSDPYLRTGSDVALLLEARDADVLLAWLEQARATPSADARAEPLLAEELVAGTVRFAVLRTPDRRVCSYLARAGDVVIVSNSQVQAARVAEAIEQRRPTLAETPEMRIFRSRHVLHDPAEDALFVLPNAAVERWTGGSWRIRGARRIRAAAALAHQRAREVAAQIEGSAVPPMNEEFALQFGSLGFLTPIAELPLGEVYSSEVSNYRSYRRWLTERRGVQLDPLAVRVELRPAGIAVEVTVLLLNNRGLGERFGLAPGVPLSPHAGDAHAGTIFHGVHVFGGAGVGKVEHLIELMRRIPALGGLLPVFPLFAPAATLEGRVDRIALYLEADARWRGFDAQVDFADQVEQEFSRLPVGFSIGFADPAAASALLEDAYARAPRTQRGVQWEWISWNGHRYLKVAESAWMREGRVVPDAWSDIALFAAVLPDHLLVSAHEPLVQNAFARATRGPADVAPWLGTEAAASIERDALGIVQAWLGDWQEGHRQIASWRNLPILNEWRRRFPGEDAIAVHERVFGQRLVCPGGGAYLWNEVLGTFESTAYGCPAAPRVAPVEPSFLDEVAAARVGLSLEPQMAHLRLEVDR